jgi:hypothetical protein
MYPNKMIKIASYVYLLICGLTIAANGQSLPPIATDRPDQTECPFIVPKGYIQAEHGFTYEKMDKSSKTLSYPALLLKYGISDNVELRLITDMMSVQEAIKPIRGFTPITIGFKTKLAEENGLLPKISFIGHLSVPNWASKAFQSSYFAPSFRFTMQHTVSEKLALAYNLSAEWDGETPNATLIYTLTTGYSLTEKLGAYLELYGFNTQNQQADHRFDGGFTYLINSNIMVDMSGGLGLSQNSPNSFVSMGFSYRFNTKRQTMVK